MLGNGSIVPTPSDKTRADIGLPRPIFMYHVDQICQMLQIKQADFFKKVAWLAGREIGSQPRDSMRCVNIAKRDETPEWRVEESEFVRWAKFHEFRTYERYML